MEIVGVISLIVLGVVLYYAYLLFLFPKTEESFAKRYPKYYKHVTDLTEKFGIPTFEIRPLGPAFSWSSYSKTFPYYKRISLEYKTGKLYLNTSRSGPFNNLYCDYPVSENQLSGTNHPLRKVGSVVNKTIPVAIVMVFFAIVSVKEK